jgi:hypothetical protein
MHSSKAATGKRASHLFARVASANVSPMRRGVARKRALRSTLRLCTLLAAAPLVACVAKGVEPDEAPRDASTNPGPRADASIPSRPPDAQPPIDAEPPCPLPLTFDLDDDLYGFFDYDHPDCEAGPGIVTLEETLIFYDEIDDNGTFSVVHPIDDWQIQDIPYPNHDCIVLEEDNTLLCSDKDAGGLVQIQLSAGSAQLDLEFRLDHTTQTVTIETLTYAD